MFRIAKNGREIAKNGSEQSKKSAVKIQQNRRAGGVRGVGSPPEGAGHLPLNLIVASENERRPDNN